MKSVAKLVLIDPENQYLLLTRKNHPTFLNDPDLPGGTREGDETALAAMLRECTEEIGVSIDGATVKQVYSGSHYSAHGTHYALFVAYLNLQPKITLSWEHIAYEWLSKNDFLIRAKSAKDTYMHMVYEMIR